MHDKVKKRKGSKAKAAKAAKAAKERTSKPKPKAKAKKAKNAKNAKKGGGKAGKARRQKEKAQRKDIQGTLPGSVSTWKRCKRFQGFQGSKVSRGPQKILKVDSRKVGQRVASLATRQALFLELQAVSLTIGNLSSSFPEGWTVKMSNPLPQDGRFDKIKEYQDCWEEALILETKAQFISEAAKSFKPRQYNFEAQCMDDTWILLDQEKRLPGRPCGQELHVGSLVLIRGADFASVGRVEMTPSNLKGISSRGLCQGAMVQVTVLGVSLVSAAREIDAIRKVRHIPALLVDQLLGRLPPGEPWRGFERMEEKFHCLKSLNPSQTKAVVRAASSSSGFVSIHGPPGTGKSQALLALVNTLHIRKLGEYHRGIEEMVLGSGNRKAPERWKEAVCHFPRLLVTAHSNAAVEQLQQRARAGCFIDQNGGSYEPIHYRLSSYNAENDQNDNVDAQIRELLSLEVKVLKEERQQLRREMEHLDAHIVKLIREIRQLQKVCPLPAGVQAILEGGVIEYVDESGCQFLDPPKPQPGERTTEPLQMAHVVGRMEELVRCSDGYRELKGRVERCQLVEDFKCGLLQVPFTKLKLRLEANILEFAHILFATANTTARLGQLVNEQAMKSFDTVVIDEAAQATEPSVIIPLCLSSGRSAVLIGDHLQLPPTVFMPNADELLVSRSLFERLCVVGHKPELLQEQYRMAPEISAFPRAYFYEGRLQDAQVVQTRPRCELVPPFLFLNLKSFAERRPDGSWLNQAEAFFCVKLVTDLQKHAKMLGREEVAKRIGIITPYRAQKNFIDQLIWNAKLKLQFPVKVATVDAYQGQEFEAVICSTVRASHNQSAGIGFLRDDRRLNVALTRAKQILLVVGHEQTLCQSKTLAALINHARKHNAFRDVHGNDDVLLTGD